MFTKLSAFSLLALLMSETSHPLKVPSKCITGSSVQSCCR
jgi:hypothetical protein